MIDFEPTNPPETAASGVESGSTTGPAVGEGKENVAGAVPVPAASLPGCWPVSATMAEPTCQRRVRRSLSTMGRRLVMAAALMSSLTALFVGLAASSSAGATPSVAPSSPAGHFGAGGQGSNARSGPAAGGSTGTVGAVAKSSFVLTTSAGQEVTVDDQSSTKYEKGTGSASKSAVTKGADVLILGTVSSTTIKATDIFVQTTGGRSKPSTAATVVPFVKGAPETSKQSGQIPASYSQGSGTIVSGTTANKATEAALTAYPGGIVDRVVKLSNGEYEVHNIGVNWPHHVFVNQDFKVVGAE
jgi:hypothetical protein